MPNVSALALPDLPPADLDLHIAALPRPLGTGLRLRGELDLEAVPTLRTAVSAVCRSRPATACEVFLLDLSGVTFIDSAGLHALNDAQAGVTERGWEPRLIPPTARAPLWLLGFAARLGWLVQPRLLPATRDDDVR